MKIRYSHEADALYIGFKNTKIENTDELTEDIIVDYDKDGNIVGIEVLDASQHVDIKNINVSIEYDEKSVKQ
ncbi:MAG: DUF2283 domain-containing protein [Candidatus Jettenia sp. CY-1]|nr:DUF2283 domain-containing protein [Candidatus Jettenia sp.]WKZ19599.1 MAG: DUF2283 domain-containing protein [Candidatus Jettenia sp. CY-1]